MICQELRYGRKLPNTRTSRILEPEILIVPFTNHYLQCRRNHQRYSLRLSPSLAQSIPTLRSQAQELIDMGQHQGNQQVQSVNDTQRWKYELNADGQHREKVQAGRIYRTRRKATGPTARYEGTYECLGRTAFVLRHRCQAWQ